MKYEDAINEMRRQSEMNPYYKANGFARPYLTPAQLQKAIACGDVTKVIHTVWFANSDAPRQEVWYRVR